MKIAQQRLAANLEQVRSRMAAAAQRVGRQPSEITLVAVTKTVDAATIESLVDLGVRHIGENRVLAARDKFQSLPNAHQLTWHLIGHLQRNKVKPALEIFNMIHSVDSLRLAQHIDQRASVLGLSSPVPILMQVNVSGELSKFGLTPDMLRQILPVIAELRNIAIRGLMTMAPWGAPPEECRGYFRKLADLLRQMRGTVGNPHCLDQLSMGMSQDFEVAIEEGATMVRVGSALFA